MSGHPAVGLYCVVRSDRAGCFAGTIQTVGEPNHDGTLNIVMNDTRQLWRWWCLEGVGLASVAGSGMARRHEVRVGVLIPGYQEICGVGQIIEATAKARASIEAYPVTQG